MPYRIGLDVGSTTAKMAVMDETSRLVFVRYERHHAQVNELVTRYFNELRKEIGNAEATLCVTGSVGMQTAELLQAPFVQEVVAATVYARELHSQAKALIDIGGEDAKVVFFTQSGTQLRMNGNCAGGTGAFIDQMATLMEIENGELNTLALEAEHVYPIAARCGVFAKTDVQNLMARNVSREDIAASIFHSISIQTITTLAHGQEFEPPILLCGGPLTFLPALRKAFADTLEMDEQHDFIILPQEAHLAPAIGCAIRSGQQTTRSMEENAVNDLKKTECYGKVV